MYGLDHYYTENDNPLQGTCFFFDKTWYANHKERNVYMIKVTKEAADQLKGALAQQEQEGLYIRIFVSGMG